MKYSFNETGNVAIIAHHDCKYNQTEYKKGQIIAFFTDVTCTMNYERSSYSAKQGQHNLSSMAELTPVGFVISAISNQKALFNLLYDMDFSPQEVLVYTCIKIRTSDLKYTIMRQNKIDINTLKIYKDGTSYDNYTFDQATNIVTFDDNGDYLLTFGEYIPSKLKMTPNTTNTEYLALQFTSTGNYNEETGQRIVNIPQAVLISNPAIVNSDDVMERYSEDLQFQIMETPGTRTTEVEIMFIQ